MGVISTALSRPGTYLGHLREVASVAGVAVRYPLGLLETTITGPRPSGDPRHDTPVVLVHGYGHNRSAWHLLERRLRAAGFRSIHAINYNPLRHDVPALAERVAARIDLVRALAGAERVHVVGHSLGGVILRWYVQELGGDRKVHTAVTVASPHEGTLAAHLWFGATARQLRHRSWLARRLEEGVRPTSVRWIAFYSNLDLLVQPATSAMIRHPALRATNILAKDHGHLAILTSPRVVRAIVAQLEAAEGADGVATLSPLPALHGATPAQPDDVADAVDSVG